MAEPYDTIFADVVAETNRPDLVKEINIGIANAIVYFHGLDLWANDVVTLSPAYTAEDGVVIINKADDLPLYRSLAEYVDECGRTATGVYINGECYPARNNTSQFGSRRCTIGFYEEANNITIITGMQDQWINSLEISYYQHPLLNPIDSLSSWIATMYPFYIVSYASKHIQAIIGNSKQSVSIDKEVVQFKNNLLSRHLPN